MVLFSHLLGAARLSDRASRVIVYSAWTGGMAAFGYYLFMRHVMHDPMELKQDADGVWSWKTLEDHYMEKVEVRAWGWRGVGKQ